MKKLVSIGFLFLLFFNFSCKKDVAVLKDDALSTVPADISMLTAIKPAQLLEKANFKEVKDMEFYQDLLEKAKKENEAVARILADPYSSGIDLNNNIYVAQDVNARNPNEIFTAIIFSLQDEAAFRSLVTQVGLSEFQEGLGYQYAHKGKQGAVAINDKYGAIGLNYKTKNLKSNFDKIFTTEKANSIRENGELAKCLNSDADIISWATSNTIADNPEAKMAMGMLNIKADDLKDNYVHSHLNFENGQVKGTSQYFLKKGITKDLKLFFKDEIETDFSQFVPGDNLSFAMALGINFKGINQVLNERPQIKSFVEYMLQEYGLTTSDIANALGGDLVVAGYGGAEAGDENMLLATNIDDQKIFDKFLLALKEFNMITPKEEGVYSVNSGFLRNSLRRGNLNLDGLDPQIVIKKDKLFITADPSMASQINGGGYKTALRADKQVMKLLKANVFAMFMDFEKMKAWNDGELQNFEITSSSNQSDMNIRLKDQQNNSLYNLLKLANKLYLKNEAENSDGKSI